MWFLIRSAFWLSIVFTLLPWPEDSGLRSFPPVAIWLRARDTIGSVLGKAHTAGEGVCAVSPIACLAEAAHIGRFGAADIGTPAGQRKTAPGDTVKPQQSDLAKTAAGARSKAASNGPPPR